VINEVPIQSSRKNSFRTINEWWGKIAIQNGGPTKQFKHNINIAGIEYVDCDFLPFILLSHDLQNIYSAAASIKEIASHFCVKWARHVCSSSTKHFHASSVLDLQDDISIQVLTLPPRHMVVLTFLISHRVFNQM